MKNILLLLLITSFLSGCGGIETLPGYDYYTKPVITREIDDFDDAVVIESNYGWQVKAAGDSGTKVRMGARWNSNHPNNIVIRLYYLSSRFDSLNFNSIAIKINNKERTFETSATKRSTSHQGYNPYYGSGYSTESESVFSMPIEYLKEMLTSEDVRIRVYTSDGYINSFFHHAEISHESYPSDFTAKTTLIAFMQEVEKEKKE